MLLTDEEREDEVREDEDENKFGELVLESFGLVSGGETGIEEEEGEGAGEEKIFKRDILCVRFNLRESSPFDMDEKEETDEVEETEEKEETEEMEDTEGAGGSGGSGEEEEREEECDEKVWEVDERVTEEESEEEEENDKGEAGRGGSERRLLPESKWSFFKKDFWTLLTPFELLLGRGETLKGESVEEEREEREEEAEEGFGGGTGRESEEEEEDREGEEGGGEKWLSKDGDDW